MLPRAYVYLTFVRSSCVFLYIFSVLLFLMGKHGANFRYLMALCGELDGW